MKLVFRKSYWALLIILLLASNCTAYKKIPYLTDADAISTEEFAKVAKKYEATIMPNDVLSITVNTSTGAASVDFNLPLLPQEMTVSTVGTLQNYIVDNEGYIVFPVLGKIKVEGMTRKEIESYIYSQIYPRYLKEEPIVNVRFVNYKVVVIGEVAKPGIYTSANGQMTIFDALASAGDLTIYGKRNDVLLIREDAQGQRSIRRIDLQKNDILLDNDLYYLQQNDKLYVQPNKAKGNNSSFGTLESLVLSGLSILISVISIVTR